MALSVTAATTCLFHRLLRLQHSSPLKNGCIIFVTHPLSMINELKNYAYCKWHNSSSHTTIIVMCLMCQCNWLLARNNYEWCRLSLNDVTSCWIFSKHQMIYLLLFQLPLDCLVSVISLQPSYRSSWDDPLLPLFPMSKHLVLFIELDYRAANSLVCIKWSADVPFFSPVI